MNYEKLYTNLILTRQQFNRVKCNDGSLERHHILPKCLGGTNNKDNLILLTPREHFIAHWLLYKMYTGKAKAKMAYAFFKMSQNNPNQKRTITSKLFQYNRTIISKSCSGENHHSFGINPFSPEQLKIMSESKKGALNPQFGKPSWNAGLTKETSKILKITADTRISNYVKADNPLTGRSRSIETKQKISIGLSNKPKSQEHKQKLSDINKGKILSEDTKQKMSVSRKGKACSILICPHCNKEGKSSAMYRWHFSNCPAINLVH